MKTGSNFSQDPSQDLSLADQEELAKLVNVLELSNSSITVFAIAPESGPDHPVVTRLIAKLADLEEAFEIQTFFYSDQSLYNFLYELDGRLKREAATATTNRPGRRLILAFGLDQLPLPRLAKEMQQLNLGREVIFNRNLVQ